MKTQKVGNDIAAGCSNWTFSGNVADSFVDHISKSVPMYREGHDLVVHLSDFFCHDDSLCYELGTSTGELLGKLAARTAHKKNVRWVGFDVEPEMVEKARAHCAPHKNAEVLCEDILSHEFSKTDMIVSYYCIQFVQPRFRQQLFDKIYQSLNWGGAFVMFEKVRGPDARFQDIATQMYTEYKLAQGYDEAEIVNKARSLKSILEPFSTQGNIEMMKRAGFTDITTIFKHICFEGFLAIK